MASVTLAGWWINDGADLSDAHYFAEGESTGYGPAVVAEVRAYAGGRRRVVTTADRPVKWDVTLTWVSQADLAWLTARMGQVVLMRDPTGRAVWGTFLGLQVTDYPGQLECSVDLSLESVSHDVSA